MDYGATKDIPEDACSLRQLRRFDSIELMYVTKVLKTKNEKASAYF